MADKVNVAGATLTWLSMLIGLKIYEVIFETILYVIGYPLELGWVTVVCAFFMAEFIIRIAEELNKG